MSCCKQQNRRAEKKVHNILSREKKKHINDNRKMWHVMQYTMNTNTHKACIKCKTKTHQTSAFS